MSDIMELVPTVPAHLPATIPIADLARSAGELARASSAAATRRAYGFAWRDWSSWCTKRKVEALPGEPRMLACYIAELVALGRRISTIALALSAISAAHGAAGVPSPTDSAVVRTTMKGTRRTLGVRGHGKDALLLSGLEQLVEPLGDRPIDLRDRALVLVGWAGAFRRSALVALDVEDLGRTPEGLAVRIRRDKTDPDGEGRLIGIPRARRPELCPVGAVERWLARAGIADGPVFRPVDRHGNVSGARLSGASVADVVHRLIGRAGLLGDYAAHSLRVGFVTESARRGLAERDIMRQTGHRSIAVLRSYIREGSIWLDNPASALL